MALNEEIKSEVKQRIDIVSLIGRYVSLRQAGSNHTGLCPFHKEKTPSFSVSRERGMYYCFGCGKGGDAFSFLMEIEGLTFSEALRSLAQECGVDTRESFNREAYRDSSGISKERYLEICSTALNFFYKRMRGDTKVVEYLKNRGLRPETVRDFRIGYAPPEWSDFTDYAVSMGYSKEELVEAGLAARSKQGNRVYDRFRDRVIFPVFDLSGRAIAFGGRILSKSSDAPKYINSPETKFFKKNKTLYGLNRVRGDIKEAGFVFFVEGYMDFLSLYQAGVRNVVATSGTAFTQQHALLIRRFCTSIVLLFDGDDAGSAAAEKAVYTLLPENISVGVILLTPGYDPDTFVREKGREALYELKENSIEGMEYVVQRLEQRHDTSYPQGKSGALKEVAPLIRGISDKVIREEYIKRLSDRLGVREESIVSLPVSEGKKEDKGRSLSTRISKYISSEEGSLIHLIMHYPDMMYETKNYEYEEIFRNSFSKKLYLELRGLYDRGENFRNLLDTFSKEGVRRLISRMLMEKPAVVETEEDDEKGIIRGEVFHKLKRLQLLNMKSKRNRVAAELKRVKDEEKRIILMNRLKELDKQINDRDE